MDVSNTINVDASWKRLAMGKGVWVLMQLRRKKMRQRQQSTITFLASWKGRVKDFRVKEGTKYIKEILVQHVYMHRELVLQEYPASLPHCRPNCKLIFKTIFLTKRFCFFITKSVFFIFSDLYPSSYEEWQPIECILRFFNVVHGAIVELEYKHRLYNRVGEIGYILFLSLLSIVRQCSFLSWHIAKARSPCLEYKKLAYS